MWACPSSTPGLGLCDDYSTFRMYWAVVGDRLRTRFVPSRIRRRSRVLDKCDRYWTFLSRDWRIVLHTLGMWNDADCLRVYDVIHGGQYNAAPLDAVNTPDPFVRSYRVGLKKSRAERFHEDWSSRFRHPAWLWITVASGDSCDVSAPGIVFVDVVGAGRPPLGI